MRHDRPAGWLVRPTVSGDAADLLALAAASDLAVVGEVDTSADAVQAVLGARDPVSLLVTDANGRLVGWGYLDNDSAGPVDLMSIYAHPDHGGPAMAPLTDLLVGHVAARAARWGRAAQTARAAAVPAEKELVAVFTAAGFGLVRRHARMRRDLSGAECAPPVPDGVDLRSVRPDREDQLRICHRLHVEAFADTDHADLRDYPAWRAWVGSWCSVPWDEWWLAEVTGVSAAVLMSANHSLEQNEGWVSRLAVDRAFRGRGLARLLLQVAFAAYAAKGRTAAGLTVDVANPTGAYRLYESVGMRPVYEVDLYDLIVSAAAGRPVGSGARGPGGTLA
jgi:GNAT superfamily N-acetyltransferase